MVTFFLIGPNIPLSILFANSFSLSLSLCFCMVQQLLVGQGLLIIEASWSHSDTPPSVCGQPDEETSTWQHTTLSRDRHLCPWQDSNPQLQQAGSHRPALDRTATGIGFPHCYKFVLIQNKRPNYNIVFWFFMWTYQTHVKYFRIMNNSVMTMTMTH